MLQTPGEENSRSITAEAYFSHRLARTLQQMNDRIGQRGPGHLDGRGLLFLLLAGAALFQFRKGLFLPAGITLLDYAITALPRLDERTEAGQKR